MLPQRLTGEWPAAGVCTPELTVLPPSGRSRQAMRSLAVLTIASLGVLASASTPQYWTGRRRTTTQGQEFVDQHDKSGVSCKFRYGRSPLLMHTA
jgi:hypothetical protein